MVKTVKEKSLTPLSRKDINNLAKGNMPLLLEGIPFIVMRESVGMRLSPDRCWQWLIMFAPNEKNPTEITRKDAIKIIDAFGMEQVLSSKDGQIYETKGKPFYNLYQKFFAA